MANDPAHGRREILLQLATRSWWYLAPLWLVAAALTAGVITAEDPDPVVSLYAMGALALGVLLPGIECMLRMRHSREVFFRQYARGRGLRIDTKVRHMPPVPMLQSGSRSRCELVMSGPIGGREASLANFTHADEARTEYGLAADVNVVKFHILHVRLPAEVARRFRGVYVHPRGPGLGLGKIFGARKVQFESAALHDRCSIRMSPEQDEIAMYELFSTTFVDALARGPELTWQQIGHDLVFFRKGHCENAMRFDRLAMDAQPVINRYLEEWQ